MECESGHVHAVHHTRLMLRLGHVEYMCRLTRGFELFLLLFGTAGDSFAFP